MFGWNPGMMDPYAAPMGGMQPQLDPSFGVQMPEMPGYDQFQFDPRQNMNQALIQAGAQMLASGDDFMGGLGQAGSTFGSVMQQEQDRARKLHEMDYGRSMDQYRLERGEAREEIGDKRWGYGEETRISGERDAELDAQREKDRETMARRERVQATGEILGVDRQPMESIDAYEIRLKEAENDRTRQQELEDYKQKREYDAIGKEGYGGGAALKSTVVKELQRETFTPTRLAEPDTDSEDPDAGKKYQAGVAREIEDKKRLGMVPKYSGQTLVGYELSASEVQQQAQLAHKQRTGAEITESDLPKAVVFNIESAIDSGRDPVSVIDELISLGMTPDAAKNVVDPLVTSYDKGLEERAVGEEITTGDSGFKGREMPGIKRVVGARPTTAGEFVP